MSPSKTADVDVVDFQALRPGDVIVDQVDEQRYRVQGPAPNGLRLHSLELGPFDISWKDLSFGQFQKLVKQGGPAARNLGDLRDEAERRGHILTGKETIRDIRKLLGQEDSDTALTQIEPMLSQARPKDFFDYKLPRPWASQAMIDRYWGSPKWVVDQKVDGVRLKLHWTDSEVRCDSRNRSTKTNRFDEKTEKFPHLQNIWLPEFEGTVLDCEGLIPIESGVLPSGREFQGQLWISIAAANASPATAWEIQETFLPMQFHCFDVLRYKGEDVTSKPFLERRKLLEELVSQIHTKVEHVSWDWFRITPCTNPNLSAEEKINFYELLVEQGGEGVILKDANGTYKEGKRAAVWQKVKKFAEFDAFVVDWVPGNGALEGYVGVLELAIMWRGKVKRVAAVSHFDFSTRQDMTAPDGTLKPEYLNKVVTVRSQEMNRDRFRHATFIAFREDKTAVDCDGYEIAQWLKS